MTDNSVTDNRDGCSRVLVVGGGGYLGSVLTGQLLERGLSVRVLDRFLFGEEPLEAWRDHPRLEIFRADICDIGHMPRALQGMDAVILLAALVGEQACNREPLMTVSVNYLATIVLAEACAHFGIQRFIFASTDSVYGIQEGILTEDSPLNPISLYAQLKAEAEQKILELASDRFSPCILRMATIYGLSLRMRFDLIVNLLTLHAATTGKCTVYGGKQWRPLVHVADAAHAYCLVLEAPLENVRGQVFNTGSNEQNYQIYQLGEIVHQVLPKVRVETTDVPPDLRDYHVNFDKIGKVLDYRVKYTVAGGVDEIYKAVTNGRIPDPYGEKYRNV